MEQYYSNFSFINKHLKEERYKYCSFYVGYYKDFYLSIKFGKGVNKIWMTQERSRVRIFLRISALKSLEEEIDKLINKYGQNI